MKTKFFYPGVFHKAEEGGFWITFPDFDHIFTQGDTIDEAYRMAVDALGLEISELCDQHISCPKSSLPTDIDIDESEQIVIIEFDLLEYKRRTNNTAVKKTLSIPGWLNEAAIAKGINFSAVLQKALMAELEIS